MTIRERSQRRGLFIGTSGWVYKEWAGDFYRGVKSKDQLAFYANHFQTVEINATFYRLPALEMVRGWQERSPDDFVFAVKGSRFITHTKRLANLHGALNRYLRRLQPLRPKIGPVLWQLPPSMKKDVPRLRNFLKRLPSQYRHAIEFREPSWLDEEVKELLRQHLAAFVSVSSMQMPMDFTVTTDFVYIRFHGLTGGARHDYLKAELEPWSAHIRHQLAFGRRCYAYFNNDLNVRAPYNAKLLAELCG